MTHKALPVQGKATPLFLLIRLDWDYTFSEILEDKDWTLLSEMFTL